MDTKEIAALLVHISDWTLQHKIGTGSIYDMPKEDMAVVEGASIFINDGIFINGNFARVLMCTYEITGEEAYLNEAKQWCDYLVYKAAKYIKTSKGNEGVWWWDFANHDIYLADTGTALHALYKIYPYLDEKRKKDYLSVLEKFYLFVSEGCEHDPRRRCEQGSAGWIIKEGKDSGALGVGYLSEPVHPSEKGFGVGGGLGWLEMRPYTISTATVGAQTCSFLYKMTGNPVYRATALNAANWLLNEFTEKGNIPYRIAGKVLEDFVFQGIHYSLEGLLTAWLFLDDDEYKRKLIKAAPSIMKFVLSVQNEDGYWGKARAYDGQRNAFLAHFLRWYYENVKKDAAANTACEKFVSYVLNPSNTYYYGVGNLIRVTGFVGLVFASMIYSELDIRNPDKKIPLLNYNINELRYIAQKWTSSPDQLQPRQK
ncbi:MAG: hypothetical protein A2Y12_11850 [Planctomycetes bacterium GWF2_42_9]|nr:MAG: hypothetical protein A2Y12_11850 [Planctomycetes bacterium GWF2_42_9]